MSDHHESPIKTPQQLITVIVLSFLVPIGLIILLANWVSSSFKPAAGTVAFDAKSTADRIKPVALTEYKDPANAVAKTGEQVYKEVCAGCHMAGGIGPNYGNAGQWAPRISQGLSALVASVIKGKGAMGARGGNSELSDAEIQNAVAYIANSAGASFKAAAPMTPAPAAGAAATTPASPAATIPVAAAAK
jgi:cytochrome c5